jgi:hypothetical protein
MMTVDPCGWSFFDVIECASMGQTPRDLTVNVMAAAVVEALASFTSEARGIEFYNMPTSFISVGGHFYCLLEPSNPWDTNSISLQMCSSPPMVLGHMAREASAHLAPLLRAGFEATG